MICRNAETRIERTLREFKVEPIKTTIGLHGRLMADSGFAQGGVDIHYLERSLK
ncbi:MAG: hypothetical protein IT438_04050 [Phycisphaerales bacterium]|nr:hypothetical protein [Phycisphaerales bacterium]